ncbi:MAG: NAD(P)/FAD-dependent oxidoreductase [Campylobacterota bacterium]|nr:NAD(P)/FAD-dependent oxidoreductase [Campylobacterota bacterium]
MKKVKYDVCIIGSGPAGYAAAMRSYDFGNHVVIIEKGELGGAGIMHGALTSKTLWELSSNYATAKRTDRGYRASSVHVNFNNVKDRVYKAAKEKQYQLISQIETFAKKPESTRSITLIKGFAKFKNSKIVVVKRESKKSIEVEAKDFIIATGSTPREHPLLQVDGKRIINSDHVLSLKKFPKSILIIGAGIVGCEFATIFANYEHTQVHLLDSENRVIPFEDDDVSNYVNEKLLDIGVIHHEATLREVRKGKDHSDIILDFKDGHTEVISVDVVLISIGRVPNTNELGLENTNVELNERGIVKVDTECRADKNIYAVGDISGNMALVNIAEMEGRFAARAIEKNIIFPLSYHNISTIMFFKPEISAIGLNEKACQAQNISYKVITYEHSIISRAIAMRETDGFFKIIVTNEENPLILGMRAAGLQSAVSIIFIATIMNNNTRLNDIMKTIHPHPSISEGIQECLRILKGKSIMKPEAFPKQIKFKVWKK